MLFLSRSLATTKTTTSHILRRVLVFCLILKYYWITQRYTYISVSLGHYSTRTTMVKYFEKAGKQIMFISNLYQTYQARCGVRLCTMENALLLLLFWAPAGWLKFTANNPPSTHTHARTRIYSIKCDPYASAPALHPPPTDPRKTQIYAFCAILMFFDS